MLGQRVRSGERRRALSSRWVLAGGSGAHRPGITRASMNESDSLRASEARRAEQGAAAPALRTDYQLSDNLTARSGQIFLTGTQALVRLPLMQRWLDQEQGLDTGGFISGYRGSPLGAYDQQLWRAGKTLQAHNIRFLPAVNEELGATAVLGSQQVESDAGKTVDGVFAIWYGKGPGVDRAADALKHGNAYGSSPRGGVLVVAGDDHGCMSSSMPHQSDIAMQSWSMPILHPATIGEVLEFGLYGFALSRFSGAWVGLKAISETIESGSTVSLDAIQTRFPPPADFVAPPGGLHYRWPDLPSLAIESRLAAKLDAVRRFARDNAIDKAIVAAAGADIGIVTCGKAHLDLLESLRRLGLTLDDLANAGVRVYKVGLSFPIEPTRMTAFAKGLKRDHRRRGEGAGGRAADQGPLLQPTDRRASGDPRQSHGGRSAAAFRSRRVAAVPRHAGDRRLARAASTRARPASPGRGFRRARALVECVGRRQARSLLLLRMPAQHVDASPGRLARPGGNRMPFHGELDARAADDRPDPDGRRGRGLGLALDVHDDAARLSESRRRHVLPFGLPGDPPVDRGRLEHHLQDPVQRRGRHDRRSAGGRPDRRRCDRLADQVGRRQACGGGDRRAGEVPGTARPVPARHDVPSSPRARRGSARAARDAGRHRPDLRPDVCGGKAAASEKGAVPRSVAPIVHQHARSARAAATAARNRTACRSSRWKPISGASAWSSRRRATRTTRA